MRLHSAQTTLLVEFAKGDWSGVSGRIRIEQPGEMLFRLAILVEAAFLAPDPAGRPLEAAPGVIDGVERELALLDAGPQMAHEARGRWRSQWFHLVVAPVPALCGQYERPADVADDLEHRGWLYHPPARPGGGWVAARFYGNPREPVTFAAAQDSDPERAAGAARARLRGAAMLIDAARERATGAGGGAARAIRDVMAWNTVWDEAHRRPYTACSRGWLRGFGG